MTHRPAPSTTSSDQRGSSLLGTAFGVAILLTLTALAADVGFGLWARTLVDAAATDAAREIATLPPEDAGPARAAAAVQLARSSLGPFGEQVALTVGGTTETVTVRVTAPALALLPRVVGGGSVVGRLDRTVVVRRESW
ncbi:MAG: hypothetical protein ACKO04_01270 [Actinomycetes bacterium]